MVTEGMLTLVPMPDFSMRFNVLALTSTVITVVLAFLIDLHTGNNVRTCAPERQNRDWNPGCERRVKSGAECRTSPACEVTVDKPPPTGWRKLGLTALRSAATFTCPRVRD